jgi:hypothetical protein
MPNTLTRDAARDMAYAHAISAEPTADHEWLLRLFGVHILRPIQDPCSRNRWADELDKALGEQSQQPTDCGAFWCAPRSTPQSDAPVRAEAGTRVRCGVYNGDMQPARWQLAAQPLCEPGPLLVLCGQIVDPARTELSKIHVPGEPSDATYDVVPGDAIRITGVQVGAVWAENPCVLERASVALRVAQRAEGARGVGK